MSKYENSVFIAAPLSTFSLKPLILRPKLQSDFNHMILAFNVCPNLIYFTLNPGES